MQIGFHVRNAFQVSHFRNLFQATPGARWIGRSVKKLTSFGININEPMTTSRFFLRHLMEQKFDIVVSQAALPGKSKLSRAKFVMVQYGYAKEPYNYGAWRAKADLILAYGPYAQERFSEHAPSISIGNPRIDDWRNNQFRSLAKVSLADKICEDKKTILYAPTWGELSSLPDWLETVEMLASDYNVLVKAHHNSVRDNQLSAINTRPNLHFLPNHDLFELMSVSDVVISDMSGAIFDAVMCKLPVVLVAPVELETKLGDKLDAQSIEVAHRQKFGIVVEQKEELYQAINAALKNGPCVEEKWLARLFRSDGNVTQNFIEALETLRKKY